MECNCFNCYKYFVSVFCLKIACIAIQHNTLITPHVYELLLGKFFILERVLLDYCASILIVKWARVQGIMPVVH